jgi:hypothetical protein
MFFNKNVYKIINDNVFKNNKNKNFYWDFEVCDLANKMNIKIVVTKPSVIQHIGNVGLNSNLDTGYDIAEDFN